MPLSVIGGMLGFLPDDAPPTWEFWVRASACWSDEINARIRKMERMRDRFTECIGCGCLSFAQYALVNPGDTLASWRRWSAMPSTRPWRGRGASPPTRREAGWTAETDQPQLVKRPFPPRANRALVGRLAISPENLTHMPLPWSFTGPA